ncbi:hypothetical protein [Bathymodiolus japonicus methanotrophic gill symbiont]|uniref:hypothetical protein n=1 Tax=Bathymodiolus japonicus methanotrophic gill symbiont TaxID=113269 RepID=UPI001C8DB34D|nr:hypothetical protein [Bathymodiolus japonicus methanotrophic gill symbiont]
MCSVCGGRRAAGASPIRCVGERITATGVPEFREVAWRACWELIPSPETDGRILVALDDSIITKVGKNIFGCEAIFDHAAESKQISMGTKYCIGRVAETGQRSLGVLIFRFPILSALKNNSGKKRNRHDKR